MNKTNFILGVGVVVLAGVAGVFYWRYVNAAGALAKCNANQVCTASQTQANGVKMSIVSVAQADSFYNIKAEYPQFEGADAAFNQKIADTVNGQIAVFKKEAKDNFDARNATMPAGQAKLQNPEQPFEFVASWTPAQFDTRYESFMIDVYYFSGGAHGIDQIFAFNYDLQNKKEITVADFLGSAANLDKLAALARAQATLQLQSGGLQIDSSVTQMIKDGTGATADNYRNFTFGYGKMTIYFEQYQAAPGSAGTVTLNFYKSDLDQAGIAASYLN